MYVEEDATKDEERSIFCDLLRIKKKLYAKRSPENSQDPIKESDVIRELAKREGVMIFVVILYPWQEGFSVCLRKPFGKDVEVFKLPYSDKYILDFIAREEIPPAMADIILEADPPLSYKGCVFADIKDCRANNYRRPRDLWKYREEFILLRPSIETIQIFVNTICESDWTEEDKIDLEKYFVKVTNEPLLLSPDDEKNWLEPEPKKRYNFSSERKKLDMLTKRNNSQHREPKFLSIYKNFVQTQMYSTPHDLVENKFPKSENSSDSESDEYDTEDDETESDDNENDRYHFTGTVRGKVKTKVKYALSDLVFRQVINVASARRLKYSKFTEEEYSLQDQHASQTPNDSLSETQSDCKENYKNGTGITEKISEVNNIPSDPTNDRAALKSHDQHRAFSSKHENIPTQTVSKKVGLHQIPCESIEIDDKTPLVEKDEYLNPIPWKDLYSREIISSGENNRGKASDIVPSCELVSSAIEVSKITDERSLKVPKFSMVPNWSYVELLKHLSGFVEPVKNANQVSLLQSSQLPSVISDPSRVDSSVMSSAERISEQNDSSITEIEIEPSVSQFENNLSVPEKVQVVEMNQNIAQPVKNKFKNRSTRTLMSLLLERQFGLTAKANLENNSTNLTSRLIKAESKTEVTESNALCVKSTPTDGFLEKMNANYASTVVRGTSISNLMSPRGIMVLHASAKHRKNNKEPKIIKKLTNSSVTTSSQIPSSDSLLTKEFETKTSAHYAAREETKYISSARVPNQAPLGDATRQNTLNAVSDVPPLHRIRIADSTIFPKPPLLQISSPRNPLILAEALTPLRPPPLRNIAPSMRLVRPPNSVSQPRWSAPRNTSQLNQARMRLGHSSPVTHSVAFRQQGVRQAAQNNDITPQNPTNIIAGIRHSVDSIYRPVNQPAILRKRKFSSEINKDTGESVSKGSEIPATKMNWQMLKMRNAYNVRHVLPATSSPSPSSSGFILKDGQVTRPVFSAPTSLRMVRLSNPTDSSNFQQVPSVSTVAQDVQQCNMPQNLSHLSAMPISQIQSSIRNIILRPTLARNAVQSFDQRSLLTNLSVDSHATTSLQNFPRVSTFAQSSVPKRKTPQKIVPHPYGNASVPSTSS